MPEYTVQEAEEQVCKAGAYFGEVLERNERTFIAVNVDGTTIVVARGIDGKKLERAIKRDGLFGPDVTVNKAPKQKPAPEPVNVTLIPRYHAPSDEYPNSKGSVHLHVLHDVTLGRRVRKSGECLCGKKRGSRERSPDGETNMCAECVKVATDHGIAWSL